jgi:hypothetical protein
MDARRTWRDVVFAKLEQKLTPEGALIDSPSCDEVRDKDLGSIDEGIQLLTKALQIKADSTDVMGFLSWLHAERRRVSTTLRHSEVDFSEYSRLSFVVC